MTTVSTVNYPTPVIVNGFSCKNCQQVDEAKKHIDPSDPKAGPYGVDAKDEPPKPGQTKPVSSNDQTPAVTFGGAFANVSASAASPAAVQTSSGLGQRLNVTA
ncbi:hypothetical protein [Phenylobacterium sp.]|uniref:hypothetical protein n=1 Tax=Phenylobacterium sp. TaxID=1871053 RepID=UPI0012297575|nr:hypothetical protein [Phenylobacterium sp.]THD61037.1 MAG: hypothetical protein E8A49_12275 [Phenylobacterium sp.]